MAASLALVEPERCTISAKVGSERSSIPRNREIKPLLTIIIEAPSSEAQIIIQNLGLSLFPKQLTPKTAPQTKTTVREIRAKLSTTISPETTTAE